ncbi:XRE family transcriptional regulator [Mesorhizobium sp. BR1-1-16]|uniref:XRE family transcriptional regulator n=1 Tax=Mesorhizobium sp. BR1-1-16 TaxID=2876653 RepID=UPI001CCD5924|nr:XRE family transcriptional regulator [Mesorhizobium sp. BR1-1-16]MBZ9939424.1 XRE family transcriptional regulator [Mesorhizobium sp. BR1-1-16]
MNTPSSKPYADTRLTKFLQKRVLELRPKKTQAAIATEAGFTNVNMLAMVKSGASKLPVDRVPGLAKALDCDLRLLARLALEQMVGDTNAAALMEAFGTVVSRNEIAWLEEIRSASGGTDPSLTA